MNWLLFTSLFTITLILYVREKRLFLHPSVLACGVFTLSALLLALNGNKWGYDISFITYIYILCALLLFSIGVNIGTQKNDTTSLSSINIETDKLYLSKRTMLLFSILSVLITYLYFRHQYVASVALGNKYGLVGMIFYLRQSSVIDPDNELLKLSTILNIGIAFVKAVSVLCLFLIILKIRNKEKKWFRYVIPLVCLVVNTILSTGRGGFISLVSMIIFDIFIVSRIQNKETINKKVFKYSVLLVCLFIIVFYSLGSLTGKSEALDFGDTVAIYAGSSILCFDHLLIHGWETPSLIGLNTFKGLYGIIGRFIGGVPSLSNHAEMVRWADYSSNVYTSFALYLRDFGLIGSLLLIFILGIFFGCVWRFFLKNRKITLLTVLYGGIFGYSLCMFSIAERILSQYIALNVITQIIILHIVLTFFVIKKRIDEPR